MSRSQGADDQLSLGITDEARPLELARGNVAQQREPLDLLVLAQTAQASARADALQDAGRLMSEMGLHDKRTQAVLGKG